MFKSLRLERFKNFEDAELTLGPFTVLIGANASGKSNIRDAFRFLHGIARGYNLTEIIGEKFSEGGERVWSGVRGGAGAIVFSGQGSFSLSCETEFKGDSIWLPNGKISREDTLCYRVDVEVGRQRATPLVRSESLRVVDRGVLFSSGAKDRSKTAVTVHEAPDSNSAVRPCSLSRSAPVMGLLLGAGSGHNPFSVDQLSEKPDTAIWKVDFAGIGRDYYESLSTYRSCRFFDWSLDALRQPCLPGQDMLGDNGRNLSSVLHAICRQAAARKGLLSWIQELTPMDAVDFEFPVDASGRILATLVERGNQKTTLASASDGTLRFLAVLAAFLGPNPSSFYFFEELENGIHPSRLGLLLDLIENQVREKGIQVVATTHSPELLARLSKPTLEHASLVYRSPEGPDARIVRVLELPEARRLLKHQKTAALFSSGWFETTAHFSETESNGSTRKASNSKRARERAK
jgi:predicted ATPase